MLALVTTYEDRILPADQKVCAVSGRSEASAIAAGHAPGMADALIAGTAKVHDMIVVTRNAKHFLAFGITVQRPEDCKGA